MNAKVSDVMTRNVVSVHCYTPFNDIARTLFDREISAVPVVEDGRDCKDIVTQFAAASRALDRAGFKIISTGLRQCILEERDGFGQAVIDREQMEKLFLALA